MTTGLPLLVVLAVLAAPAAAERQASLTAQLTLSDPAGTQPLGKVASGAPFRLAVKLTDAATGRAPCGLYRNGWIRPAAPGNPSCEEAARAFRATRAIPLDAVDLKGILLVMASTDGSLGVIDPKLNLRSSNMLAAAELTRPPDAMVADAASMRAYLIDRDAGAVQAMSLHSGALEPFAEGLASPVTAMPAGDGSVWVLDAEGAVVRLGHDGAETARLTVAPGTNRLAASAVETVPMLAAWGAARDMTWFEAFEGRTLGRIGLGFDPLDAKFLGREALLLLRPDAVAEIRYLDDPGRALPVPLGFAATRRSALPRGRIALAYAPGDPRFSLIDTATASVVQAGALDAATIDEVAFTDRAAFLLCLDGGFVGPIDLTSVAVGAPVSLRRVDLGHKSAPAEPGAQLLVPLEPSPQIPAVDPETQTGWIVHEIAATAAMPPMDSASPRGACRAPSPPSTAASARPPPGWFETMAQLASGAPTSWVLATGIGGFTACLPVTATGPAARIAARPLTLTVEPEGDGLRADRSETLALELADEAGRRLPLETLDLLVPSLQSGWSTRVTTRRTGGALKATLRFPHGGTFAVQPLGSAPHWQLRSAIVLEVRS